MLLKWAYDKENGRLLPDRGLKIGGRKPFLSDALFETVSENKNNNSAIYMCVAYVQGY